MSKTTLKAEKRKLTGRKVKSLRKEGKLPSNVYGKDVKSLAVETNLEDFKKIYKEVGETGLVELQVGSDKKPVLIHNVQTDPVDDSFLHADFYQVNLKEKVTSQIPLELVGESPAEKLGLGTVVQYIDEIEVEALPTDLPDKFELDISKLKDVDEAFLVSDLKVDKKVEIKSDPEQMLVKVEAQREEEEEVVAETEEGAEGEPTEGGDAEEGKESTEAKGDSKDAPKEEGKDKEEAPKK